MAQWRERSPPTHQPNEAAILATGETIDDMVEQRRKLSIGNNKAD